MDPKLLDIPESFETDRLVIRMPRVGDGRVVNAAVVESAAELRPWMPWADPVPTVEQSESHAREAIAKWVARADLLLWCFLKDGGGFAVGTGLHEIDWAVPRFEIGYWCRTSLTGRGYVTEAVRAVAGFAFGVLSANRVEIRCDDTNVRSARVAERAGFALEGVHRNAARRPDGRLRDTRVYAVTMWPPGPTPTVAAVDRQR